MLLEADEQGARIFMPPRTRLEGPGGNEEHAPAPLVLPPHVLVEAAPRPPPPPLRGAPVPSDTSEEARSISEVGPPPMVIHSILQTNQHCTTGDEYLVMCT